MRPLSSQSPLFLLYGRSVFQSITASHQNKPCFLAFLFGGQRLPHTRCFSPEFHFTPRPGLRHPWPISVACQCGLSQKPPLLASSLVLPPQARHSRPLVLQACAATVTLFPHPVTSHPASRQEGVPRLPSAPGSLGHLPALQSLPSAPGPSGYVVLHHVFGVAVPQHTVRDKQGWVQPPSQRRGVGCGEAETLHRGRAVHQQ